MVLPRRTEVPISCSAMAIHPSVLAPFEPPLPLRPQRVMDPYKPCWCLSGKKWKWCHKNRDAQKPVPLGQALAAIPAEFTKGYCSHPDAALDTCSDKIIRAHTVQRAAGLGAVAENGHVISVKTAFRDLPKNAGRLVPGEIGVHHASTFMGFCNKHDTAMFRAVERGVVALTPYTCFLLAFRALAFELFEKRAALRLIEVQRDLDKGRPFEYQCQMQQFLHTKREGMLRALADLERWKASYDAAFLEHRFETFRFLAAAFSETLPVVGCGGFFPESDFQGQTLQKLGRYGTPYELVTYNLTVVNGRSVVVLGWSEGDKGPASAFVRSFANLAAGEKADAAVRLGFEHIGNLYMKPSWWHGLPEPTRNSAIARMPSGGVAVARRSDCLKPDGLSYAPGVYTTEILTN